MANEHNIFYNVPKSRVERMQQSTAHFDLNAQINEYIQTLEKQALEVKKPYRQWTLVYSAKAAPYLGHAFGYEDDEYRDFTRGLN